MPQGFSKTGPKALLKKTSALLSTASPEELKKAIAEAITTHNATPHESQDNVSPNDVYAGRKEVILKKRQEKKRLTLERRKKYNLESSSLTKTTTWTNIKLQT